MPQLQAAGDVGVQPAPAVDDRVVDRLERGEPVADLGHVRPRLRGVVVDAGEHPHPPVRAGPRHRRVGAPPLIGCLGDDRAVMRARPAAATHPLWGQQPVGAQEPQDPFAAHVDAVLTAQPGADLAVALPGERGCEEHLADQLEQVGVADRRGRTRPRARVGAGAAGVHTGAGRAEHAADHGHGELVVYGYLGRFAGGICNPLFSAAARRISFSMVSCPILRSASLSCRSSGDRSGR